MKLNRRQFCMAALTAPALAAQSEPPPLIDRGFARVSKLADGVYVTIANPPKGLQALSNGGVIAGRDGVLLIEGHFRPAAAALEIEAASLVSKMPIVSAINTHYHYDHTFGNQAYAEQRIPIIGHERSPGLMKERYSALKGVDKNRIIAPLKANLERANDPEEKKRLQGDIFFDQLMYSQIDSTNITYPTDLLGAAKPQKRLDLGGITAVIETHQGHTPTDLIIRIPDLDIVFTGDLLFYRSYPVSFDADMVAWRGVLETFLTYSPKTRFIPGHGEVCGPEAARDQIGILDDLRSYAEKMKRAGMSSEEAGRRYTIPARFREFDSSGWAATIGAAVRNYYR